MKIIQHKIHFLLIILLISFIQFGCSQRNLKKGTVESPTIETEERANKEKMLDVFEKQQDQGDQNSLISIELIEELPSDKNASNDPTVTNEKTSTITDIAKKEKELKDQKAEEPGKNSGFAPKPAAKIFRVRLKIQNKNDQPVWYLMPYKGSNTLLASGNFETHSTDDETDAIEGRRYQGDDNTELIELLFSGKKGHHFRAFYIPAQSSFTLSNYVIDCWQDTDKVELWAVKELLVNNQKSLADWVSFEMLSSPNVVIRCDKENGCQYEEIQQDNAIQAEANGKRINHVRANKVNKYSVQLQTN